jgi:L-lactate dehydrogenase
MGKEFALPKVAVIGAGRVGSTTAFTLMVRGLAGEIVICNRNVDRAKGEALDIAHGVPLLNTTKISYGDYEACAGADVVVLTLGAAQKPGETRLELVKRNADIFREVVPQIVKAAPDAVLLIVSNPVDVLTYLTTKVAGLPAGRVFGSGTVLDTARARFEIARFEPCDMRDLQVFVLGEHGDSEVIPWSIYQVAA